MDTSAPFVYVIFTNEEWLLYRTAVLNEIQCVPWSRKRRSAASIDLRTDLCHPTNCFGRGAAA